MPAACAACSSIRKPTGCTPPIPARPASACMAGACRCRAARCSAARRASITWSMCAAIPATSTPGPRAAPPVGATPTCCPISARARASTPSDDTPDRRGRAQHDGPLGVSVRSPVLPARAISWKPPAAAGIPRGDYNGRDRGGAAGVASVVQTTTRKGKRSSTYHAFLEGEAESRPNLTIVTGATRPRAAGRPNGVTATGVEYRNADGEHRTRCTRDKEVIVSAGAVGSPHLLMLSGIGPRRNSRPPASPASSTRRMSAST